MPTLQGPGLVQAMKIINTAEGAIPRNGQLLGAHMDTFVSSGQPDRYRVGGTSQYVDANGQLQWVDANTKIDQATAVRTLQYQAGDQYFQNVYKAGGDAVLNADPNAQGVAVAISYASGNSQATKSFAQAVAAGESNEQLAQRVENLQGFPEQSKALWAAQLRNGGEDVDRIKNTGTNNAIDSNIDPNGKGGGAGGAGGPPGAPGAKGGGAGCASGGCSPSSLMSAAGLQQGLGMATNGLVGQLTGALGGGPLGSVMGDALKGALQGGVSGLMSGQGLNGFVSGFTGGITSGLTSQINQMTGGIMDKLSSIGGSILPSLTGVLPPQLSGMLNGAVSGAIGQLTAPLSGILQNPLGFANAAQQFASNGGLAGMIKQVASNMVGGAVGGGVNALMNNIGAASTFSSISNTVTGGVSELSSQSFGTAKPGGLGANFNNMNDVLSFGVSALTRNLAGASNNMLNAGNFDISNSYRIMQPGNVANQIMSSGLGTSTGLTKKLVDANIPLAGVDNPVHDNRVQQILTTISDPASVGAVSSKFNVGVKLDHLGQLTDLNHMMPDLASSGPHKNFKDLGEHFISLGINKVSTFPQVGEALCQVDPGYDLNHVSQLDKPGYQPAIDKLNQTFGYGGGSLGEITMADFMGTAAGYVHNDTLPHIIAFHDAVMQLPEGVELQRRMVILKNITSGVYNVPASTGSSDSSGLLGLQAANGAAVDMIVITPKVSVPYAGTPTNTLSQAVSTSSGFIFSNVTTADGGAVSLGTGAIPVIHDFGTTPYDNIQYFSLDACLTDFIPYVEAQLQVIANLTDPTIKALMDAAEKAHAASCAQLLKENHMVNTYGMDFFNTDQHSNDPINAYVFADGLQYMGDQMGYGQMGHFIERLCTDDIWGDSIKATMRQGKNAQLLAGLGINVDRFKLPHSLYYRDPYAFATMAYQGNLPYTPEFLLDQAIPATPEDTYVEIRNQKLTDSGYTPSRMLSAQADEAYYDLQWADASTAVRENIGLNVLNQAINRNTFVVGNKCYIRGLDRKQTVFALINANGLNLVDNEVFVGNLLSICNKMLYGNIGTTKYDNPFFTDQMVYGVLEMLAQVTPGNADALGNTLLGSQVLNGLLDKIRAQFASILRLGNTAMDRNDETAWGAAGPDGHWKLPSR
jgi:hypothetical protein